LGGGRSGYWLFAGEHDLKEIFEAESAIVASVEVVNKVLDCHWIYMLSVVLHEHLDVRRGHEPLVRLVDPLK
jgi:hypothetical protein